MWFINFVRWKAAKFVWAGFVLLALGSSREGWAQTTVIRVMAANLNGNSQTYEPFALRIFQGLKPDVVAIQEFNYLNNSPANLRAMVDTAFGTNYGYYREPGYAIPNGIISRFPVLASGSWADALQGIPNRGFAWAQLDVPGSNDLYVVSVHLLSGAGASARAQEAGNLATLIRSNFPTNAWVIVAGDMNTDSRSESAITVFKTFLSDAPVPTDAASGGSPNTNEPRSKPYDYVLPNFSLATLLTNVDVGTQSFPNGLVFDSRTFPKLSEVAPVQLGDSGSAQHMAVMKAFSIDGSDAYTNAPGQRPIITSQPASQIVKLGDSATFQVVATGDAPLEYQWRFGGEEIAGASASSFTRTNVQTADTGVYTVRVSNAAGSATSAGATLSLATETSGDVVVQWNFNQTNGSVIAPLPSLGSGVASLTGMATASWASGVPADAGFTNTAWNTANYPAQGTGNKTAGVQFKVSTVGRKDVKVRWDLRASNTGSKYLRLLYSTNGVLFHEFPLATKVSTATVFESVTNNLSGIPGIDDNPNFTFRLVAEFESTTGYGATAGYVGANGTYGTAGTLRFDLVTVLGSPLQDVVPGPAILTVLGPGSETNWFHFSVNGDAGGRYVIQEAFDPGSSSWNSLLTNTAPFVFGETNHGAGEPRFFRAIGVK
jgi:endonuclease/exonuclease/phosphatase family metal-dependent hydrolase